MWDQPTKPQINAVPKRINPTFVGSTRLIGATTSLAPNHSHVCGINKRQGVKAGVPDESFPRMWDQQSIAAANRENLRIIPTYVGSTFFVGSVFKFDANHSHVCGINECSLHGCTEFDESFPRMWDQLLFLHYINHGIRIIPTYVGSTRGFKNLMQITTNHSHVCGINA